MLSNIHENIWTDGCFDLFHYGHANHLRQAKSMATNLIVGLHSDMDIAENKKNSVTCLSERMFVMNSIKYVNKVVINTPYVTDLNILNQNNCHFCIHGNDKPLCVNGQDPYRFVKENGRYKSCARTRFISTTEIIERVLFPSFERNLTRTNVSSYSYLVGLLDKFREGHYLPCSGDNVVYIGGKFDILHPFLLHYLKKLKSPDNYLIVGVYSDQDIRKNLNFYPTLNSLERCLALSACRFVDWVVLDAPFKMKKDFIRHYNVFLHLI
uniref:ethanolamine-phosphate cytidylyltransferase n=1 Tax=Henneguya salminicola TaxID=69463 RepID=A0A6G3MI39_HENSL